MLRVEAADQVLRVDFHVQAACTLWMTQLEFLLEILPEGFQFNILYIGLIAFVQRGNVFNHLVDARNIFFHHVGQFGDLRLLVFVAFAQ